MSARSRRLASDAALIEDLRAIERVGYSQRVGALLHLLDDRGLLRDPADPTLPRLRAKLRSLPGAMVPVSDVLSFIDEPDAQDAEEPTIAEVRAKVGELRRGIVYTGPSGTHAAGLVLGRDEAYKAVLAFLERRKPAPTFRFGDFIVHRASGSIAIVIHHNATVDTYSAFSGVRSEWASHEVRAATAAEIARARGE